MNVLATDLFLIFAVVGAIFMKGTPIRRLLFDRSKHFTGGICSIERLLHSNKPVLFIFNSLFSGYWPIFSSVRDRSFVQLTHLNNSRRCLTHPQIHSFQFSIIVNNSIDSLASGCSYLIFVFVVDETIWRRFIRLFVRASTTTIVLLAHNIQSNDCSRVWIWVFFVNQRQMSNGHCTIWKSVAALWFGRCYHHMDFSFWYFMREKCDGVWHWDVLYYCFSCCCRCSALRCCWHVSKCTKSIMYDTCDVSTAHVKCYAVLDV